LTTHPLKIVHHHAFKSAGSTVMWILERNFPEQVLYIEGETPIQRIYCEDVSPYIDNKKYKAVSSHLLTIPEIGKNIADIHFSLLRDPVERTVSAYHFFIKRGDIDNTISLEEFCQTDFQSDNFQMKHSSIKDNDTPKGEWGMNRKIYEKIDSGEVFFGLVEYFDHTMLMLDDFFAKNGTTFDGAYPQILNRSSHKKSQKWTIDDKVMDIILRRNESDIELYNYAKKIFLHNFQECFEEKDLDSYRHRCAVLKRKFDRKWWKPRPVIVPDHTKWVRIGI